MDVWQNMCTLVGVNLNTMNIISDNYNKRSDNYCIILAGGKGRRLWPYSRERQPKQFIDFFGSGRTLLQSTYDRLAKVIPNENILVCTMKGYEGLVKEQLPDINSENIVIEPVNRNTAPSVAWANLHINKRNPKARVIVAPSDQMIVNDDAFLRSVISGLDFVADHDVSLTMGIRPTRPEPGYGYIQKGDTTETEDVFTVQSFTEKPEREFAKMFVESGEFLWNTGMFLFNTSYLYRFFIEVFVEDFRQIGKQYPNYTVDDAIEFTKHLYLSAPNMSLDYAVLEKREDVCVMRCDFGWADIGSWHAMYECMSKGDGDNVVIDSNVILKDCHNNIVKLPSGKLGVINGLDDFIIVDRDDVLLICKKSDSSSMVRNFINEAQVKFGEEYL